MDILYEHYVEQLTAVGVSALAVDVTESSASIPQVIIDAANDSGLVVIALTKRVPFVELCKSVDTAIIMSSQQHASTSSIVSELPSLLQGLSTIPEICDCTAHTLKVNVLLFSSKGELLYTAKSPSNIEDSLHRDLIHIENNDVTIGSVELIGNHTWEESYLEIICECLTEAFAPILHPDPQQTMLQLAMKGPRNNRHASSVEGQDASAFLSSSGFSGSCIYYPFMLTISSIAAQKDYVENQLSQACTKNNYSHAFVVEGNLIVGFIAASDASGNLSEFCETCASIIHTIVTTVGCGGLIDGAKLDVIRLIDGFGMLRLTLAYAQPTSGIVLFASEYAIEVFAGLSNIDEGARLLATWFLGSTVIADRKLIETLSVFFDCLGNKTTACMRLSIQRQTLYSRLDKISRLSGYDQNDKTSWAVLLLAAKLAEARSIKRL